MLGQFTKEEETNECKTNRDLLTLTVLHPGMQMKLEAKRKKYLKITRGKKEINYDSNEGLLYKYGNWSTDIPLEVSLLIYLKYLDPANRKKEISVVKIGKLAQLLSHVINEREVTLVQD